MEFVRSDVPASIAMELTQRGQEPVCVYLGDGGEDRLVVIVSRDPSGPAGAWELHASISASSYGKRRVPSPVEIENVTKLLDMDPTHIETIQGSDVVHLFAEDQNQPCRKSTPSL